jgi:hypothetical protein
MILEYSNKYILMMKYLIKYKLFESTESDLRDMLLDLEDDGYRVSINDPLLASTGEPSNIRAVWIRDNSNPSNSVGKDWSELRDYALRIKDYLDDKYLSFAWRPIIFVPLNDDEKPFRVVELNEDTQIDGKIWSFVIKYIL